MVWSYHTQKKQQKDNWRIKHTINYYSSNALDGILFKESEFPPLTLVTSGTLAVMGSWGSVHVQSLILLCLLFNKEVWIHVRNICNTFFPPKICLLEPGYVWSMLWSGNCSNDCALYVLKFKSSNGLEDMFQNATSPKQRVILHSI